MVDLLGRGFSRADRNGRVGGFWYVPLFRRRRVTGSSVAAQSMVLMAEVFRQHLTGLNRQPSREKPQD